MANYYLLFSTSIPNINKEEKEWLEKELEPPKIVQLTNTNFGEDILNPDLKDWMEVHNIKDLDDAKFWPDLEWDFDEESNFIIMSQEGGNIENLATIIARFFRRFRPSEIWSSQWAETCDKPLFDAFGGGAVIVTANETRWLYTSEWIKEQLKQLGKKQ